MKHGSTAIIYQCGCSLGSNQKRTGAQQCRMHVNALSARCQLSTATKRCTHLLGVFRAVPAAVGADGRHQHQGVQCRQLGQPGPVKITSVGQVELQKLQVCSRGTESAHNTQCSSADPVLALLLPEQVAMHDPYNATALNLTPVLRRAYGTEMQSMHT